jgi:hypothetical protein
MRYNYLPRTSVLCVVLRAEMSTRRGEASELKAQLASSDAPLPRLVRVGPPNRLASPRTSCRILRLTSSLASVVTLESSFQLKNNPFST